MLSYLNILYLNAFCDFNRFSWPRDRFDRFFLQRPAMMIFGLVILVLVIVGIVFLVRALVRSGRSSNTTPPAPPSPPSPPAALIENKALQILDERLARGEISPEEYRQRKEELLRP